MNYTPNEALNEVLARRDRVRRKRERRRLTWYSVSVCAILVVLTMTVTSLPTVGQNVTGEEAMGSFLLEAKTGGILAALVLAFGLGIVVALLWIKKKRSSTSEEHPQKSQEDENGGEQL